MAIKLRPPHFFLITLLATVFVSVVDGMVYEIYYFPKHFSYDYSGKYFGMNEKLDIFISYLKSPLGIVLNLTFVFLSIISAGLYMYLVYYAED